MVDWDVTERAMKSLPDGIQRWCSKHTAGMCAVGKVLLDRKQADNDHCPLCGKSEDHRHVPRCGDKRACKEWNSRVDEFIQWSTNFGTAPEINIAFKHCLRQIREPAHQWAPEEIPGQVIPHHLIHQAYGLQSMIGPQGFLEGLLSCKWANAQERYFAFKGSRRSGRKWASQVAHQLIKIGFHMWEHRNQVFHSDESIGNKRLGEKIDREIRQQFSTDPSNLSAAARYDLRNSIGRILKRSLAERIAWVQWIQAEREMEERRHKGQRRLIALACKKGNQAAQRLNQSKRVIGMRPTPNSSTRRVSLTSFHNIASPSG